MIYAFRTAAQKEFAAETLITERLGLPVFLPREIKYKRVGLKRKRVAVVYPMIPRYIFADVPSSHVNAALLAISALNPVQGVIGIAGVPAVIPREAIQRLMKLSGTALPTKVQPVHRSFAAGDRVEISKGPFRGNIVPVIGITGRHARVIMDMFGAIMEISIELEALEAA